MLVAYINVVIPIEIGKLINAVSSLLKRDDTDTRDVKQILWLPTKKLLQLYIYQAIATFEYITLLSIAGERISGSIRRDLFDNILRLDMEFYDRTKTGEIMDR